MASLYDWKPQFQRLLRPLAGRLAALGATANQVTIAAALLSLASGALMAALADRPAILLLLPVVLLVRMALNAIDGMLAREHGQATPLGAMLNEIGDVVADAALYLPFAAVPGSAPWPAVAVVLLAGLSEVAGLAALLAGASRRYDGPMGKSDRALAFGALALLLGLGVGPGPWLAWALWLMAALLCLTVIRRLRSALGERRPA